MIPIYDTLEEAKTSFYKIHLENVFVDQEVMKEDVNRTKKLLCSTQERILKMLYRGKINGIMITTHDLSELSSCNSIDIFISGLWQVWI